MKQMLDQTYICDEFYWSFNFIFIGSDSIICMLQRWHHQLVRYVSKCYNDGIMSMLGRFLNATTVASTC